MYAIAGMIAIAGIPAIIMATLAWAVNRNV
jgi:hypothetical protein